MDPAVADAAADRVRRPRRFDVLLAAAVALVAQVETWLTAAVRAEGGLRRRGAGDERAARMAPGRAGRACWRSSSCHCWRWRWRRWRIESSYVMLVLLVAFAAAGAYCERRTAVIGVLTGMALLALRHRLRAPRGLGQRRAADRRRLRLPRRASSAIVWTLAVALRERSAARRRAASSEPTGSNASSEEQARAAVAEERARIARELHDVVAHSVSVIAVQTGSIRRRLRSERPAEAAELSAVEQTARQALAEMRRMLGLLRADDEGPSLAPQPGMDRCTGSSSRRARRACPSSCGSRATAGRCRPASTSPPTGSSRRR